MSELLAKVMKEKRLNEQGGIVMKIDEWVIREVIDTLHQANITLLGITGLDSEKEFAKKCVENETAINRRIYKAISLLKSSVKKE